MSIHSGDSSLVHSPGEKDHALDKKMSHTGPTTTNTADVDPEKVGLTHTKSATAADSDEELRRRAEVDDNLKLVNPLLAFTREEIIARAHSFATERCGYTPDSPQVNLFERAALAARFPKEFETIPELTEADREAIRRETTHRWDQPLRLYLLVVTCSLAAAVQGMDEAVISGANLFWPDQLGVPPRSGDGRSAGVWIQGLVNAAPYICCALVASFFTEPLNRIFGRRGTIFISCFIAFATCIWSGVTNVWWHLFIARFFLGFGIGPKSSTVPVYAAECTPPAIRGGLVMQWQLWTAFGIMMGYVADIGFYFVPDRPGAPGLNWRLMLGSAGIPAIFVMALVFTSPESPRWLMGKGRYDKAFEAFCQLRRSEFVAARETYLVHEGIEAEKEVAARNGAKKRWQFFELFANHRNRKGAATACMVQFSQQFCGINVTAYYGAQVFANYGGATNVAALGASLGFGALNWIFGFPAIWSIDRWGRRNLALFGFPTMSLSLFFAAFSFLIPEPTAKLACVALGIYLHCCFYSPTLGPIPFTVSAESFPLNVRMVGMSLATSTTWFFNAVLSLTFPALLSAWTPTGAFGWYAAWNLVLWAWAYFFMPETKGLSLEELDAVFSVPHREHAGYYARKLPYYVQKKLFCRRNIQAYPPLYEHEKLSMEERKAKGFTENIAAAGH